MAMSTVDLGSLPREWEGRGGTLFEACPTAGRGYLFVLVYTVRSDGARVPFDTVDLHAEDSVTGAFDAWREARTGYAASAEVAA